MAKDNPDFKAPAAPVSNIPDVGLPKVDIPVVSDVPTDDKYADGLFTMGGEKYALAIVKDEPHGKTHFAKNSLHFWNGTETEFKAAGFEKV